MGAAGGEQSEPLLVLNITVVLHYHAECLEELGILIRDNGMVICGPQPQKTVPLIASQISDRDNAVRSAALNTMVIVYGNVGDGVFKFTSKVSIGHGVDVCIQNSCSIIHILHHVYTMQN